MSRFALLALFTRGAKLWPLVLVILIGLGSSLLAAMIVQQREQHRIEQNFDQMAEDYVGIIRRGVAYDLTAIQTVAGLFNAQENVSREDFRQFTQPILSYNPSIYALEWIPRVTFAEKDAFEQQGRQDIDHFRFFDLDPNGQRVSPPDLPDYFPVFYAEPYEPNKYAIGFTATGVLARQAAIDSATDSARITASESIRLLQEQENQRSVLIFVPVYQREMPIDTVEQRRVALKGLVLGIVRMGDLVNRMLERAGARGLNVLLEDNSAQGERYLYRYTDEGAVDVPTRGALKQLEHVEFLPMASRAWRIEVTPAPGAFVTNVWYFRNVLLVGLAMTLMLAVYLFSLLNRNRLIYQQVDERTEELSSAYAQLAEESQLHERTAAALKSSEERFDVAMRGANDGLWDWHIEEHWVYFSPRWKQMLGYQADELHAEMSEWRSRIHVEDRPTVLATVSAHLANRTEQYESVHRMRHKNGAYVWVLDRGKALRNQHGRAYRMAGTMIDITERKRIEDDLFTAKERAEVTLASIGNAVIITNTKGVIEYLNPAAENLCAQSEARVRGRMLDEVFVLINEQTREPIIDTVQACIQARRASESPSTYALMREGLDDISVDQFIAPLHDQDGDIVGCVVVMDDVTSARKLTRELAYQATHDPLTGLINRREFEHRLQEALYLCQVDQSEHVLFYIDLDQFKVVNDTCGHEAGDELLRQLSRILQQQLRASDDLARLGGDEFALLLRDCKVPRALELADKLLQVVRDFQFVWQKKPFAVGMSIGIVAVERSQQSVSQLLSIADTECYVAKDKGRNRYQLYQGDGSDSHGMRQQMEWVSIIREAMDQDRFQLRYQTIQSLNTPQQPMHFEILISMLGEGDKVIPPGAFIPAAERYNLMPRLDRYVVEKTLKFLAENPQFIQDNMRWALNLSANSVNDPSTVKFICECLDQYQIPASSLCFEITETSVIANLTEAIDFIAELKQRGCHFALDDFGSGMSSFGYLKQLPVDYLKVDGNFVRDMDKDPIDHAMVEAINHIGHVMGMQTIAEFVENAEILSSLRHIGVDYAQGYHLHHPQPLRTHNIEQSLTTPSLAATS